MIFYTNAPKEYDYGCTDELDPDVGRLTSGMDQDKPVRKLDIRGDGWHAETQIMRNSSGLYPTLTEEQYEEWLEAGFLIPASPGSENSAPEESVLTPPPADAYCAHCNASASIEDVGITCHQCGGRGTIIASTSTAPDADEDDEDDESDYSRGTEPGSWCEDDELKRKRNEKGE